MRPKGMSLAVKSSLSILSAGCSAVGRAYLRDLCLINGILIPSFTP